MPSRIISESGVTLTMPDNNFFRFEECKGYQKIQNHFKEMDACWYDKQADTLYIIELKDWSGDNIKQDKSEFYITNFLKKSIDSLSMIISILLKRPYSANIQACMPFEITTSTKIKLLFVINWNSNDVNFVSNINDAYKARFNAYAKLYEINTFIVLTKQKAASKFSWIT